MGNVADRGGDGPVTDTEQPTSQGSSGSSRIGIVLLLLSLIVVGVAFVAYYTIDDLNGPIRALGGLYLTNLWRLSRLFLWMGLSVLFLLGPLRTGGVFPIVRRIGWAVWVLALPVAFIWLMALLVGPRWRSGAPATWGRMAELALSVALLLGALAFDFRASPWVRRNRGRLLNTLALAVGILAAAGLAEAFLRKVYQPPVFPPMFIPTPLPGCEFVMLPHFDGIHPNVRVRLNSEGFRTPEVSPQKTRKRILAIGDSCTFGAWVEQDKAWPAVLQTLVPRDRYEVINAGIPAYALSQVIALFQHKGAAWQPDVVVYMFVYDDITDALVPDGLGYFRRHPDRNYGGNTPRPAQCRLFPFPPWLLYRSYLLRAIVTRYHYFRDKRLHKNDQDLLADLLAERWGWLEDHLVQLRDAVGRTGARFLLVVFPVGLSDAAIDRIAQIARRHGIEVLSLRPVLGDAETYVANYMTRYDSHPNATAHGLIARAVHERLVADGFLEGNGPPRLGPEAPLQPVPAERRSPGTLDPVTQGQP